MAMGDRQKKIGDTIREVLVLAARIPLALVVAAAAAGFSVVSVLWLVRLTCRLVRLILESW